MQIYRSMKFENMKLETILVQCGKEFNLLFIFHSAANLPRQFKNSGHTRHEYTIM